MRRSIIKRALTGTEKYGMGSDPAEEIPAGIRDLMTQIDERKVDDSWKILLSAGIEYLADRVAFHPEIESDPVSLCQRNDKPTIPVPIANLLLEFMQIQLDTLTTPLTASSLFLIDEAIQYGGVVPDEKIPDFLRLFSRSDLFKTREARILPLLGKTANWLGSLNPDWQWCSDQKVEIKEKTFQDLFDLWEEGNFGERKSLLQLLRQKDPGKARDLLRQTWKNEKVEHRAAFLSIFEKDLEEGDIDFLEQALSDRGPTVRSIAGDLLACLPQSEYSQRMKKRAEKILFSNSLSKTRYGITPPEKFSSEMKKDALEEKAAYKMSDDSWWIFQIISRTPLLWLEERAGTGPEELLARYKKDDFFSAFVVGCTKSLMRTKDSLHWFEPLWNIWTRGNLDIPRHSFFDLSEDLLEYGIRNHIGYFRQILDHGGKFSCSPDMLHKFWSALAEQEPDPRRPEFSRPLLNYLRNNNWFSLLLIEFAALLPEHDREILWEYFRPGSVICKESQNKMKPVQRILNLSEQFEKYIKSRKEMK